MDPSRCQHIWRNFSDSKTYSTLLLKEKFVKKYLFFGFDMEPDSGSTSLNYDELINN